MLWELMEAVPVAKREEEQSGFEEVFRTQKFSSVLVLDGQGFRDGMIPGLSRCDIGEKGYEKKKEGFEST